MLYRGTKPGVLYKGAYKPGKLYKGTQLVAGYVDVSKAAPASWDGTYDDVVGVAAQGRGKQQTYSGAQLLDISTCTINSVKPYNLTITRDGDVVRIQSTAVSGDVGGWYSFVLLWSPNADLSGKGYVITPFLLQGSIEKVYGLRNAEETSIACVLILTEGEAVDVALRLMVSVDTPTAYEPYVGGQPSPSPDYPQPLVASEGSLTASGRTGTTPTTVTLPVLRAIPGSDIRDEMAYIGGGQWQVTRRVGVIDSYAGESVGNTWASSTGQLTTGAVVWYALATPATETVTLGTLPSYPVHTELAVSGDYPPDVTGTVKIKT
jgi:hypothetical protein|nr:MAG TPA: hypothetical protein [Caudoviricetes sp.]